MKNLYRSLFLVMSFFLFFGSHAIASHLNASDLTWECKSLKGGDYTFSWSVYADCDDIPPSSLVYHPSLNFTGTTPGSFPPVALSGWTLMTSHHDVTQLCPGQVSDCNGGSIPGIYEFIWSRDYSFGSPSLSLRHYEIDWHSCCRSNNVTSTSIPLMPNMATKSEFTFNPLACDHSPVFRSPPTLDICNGQTTTIAMNAVDADGDAMTFTLESSKQFISQSVLPVNYAAGFSATSPLGPNWNVSVDPSTGDITFIPINGGAIEVGIFNVRVDEYRNGTKIGSIVRDMYVRVNNCSNNLPTLSGIDGSTTFTTKACVGDSVCFFVTSDDIDASDNLTVTILQNDPSATVTTVDPPHPLTTICWVPTFADVGLNTFILEVKDDACPSNGVQQYTYIYDIDPCNAIDPCDSFNLNASFTYSINQLNGVITNTSTGSGISFTEYYWGDTPANAPDIYTNNHSAPVSHTFPGPGTYEVCVKVLVYSGNLCCHDIYCDSITIPPLDPCADHRAEFWYSHQLGSCDYGFTDQSSPGSSQVLWDFGNGIIHTGSPISYTFPSTGTYIVTMTSIYHPPSNPTLCCSSSVSRTIYAHCGGGNEYENPHSKVAWNAQNETVEVEFRGDLDNGAVTRAQLFDLNGRMLGEKTVRDSGTIRFDLAGMPGGIYLLRLINGETIETRKFVKH